MQRQFMSEFMTNRLPYYFEALPRRLPVEQFQSLVGYTLNLCPPNNIHTQAAFKYIFSSSTSHFDNFPRSSFGDMSRTANVSHSSLLSLTYYHLLLKFGKANSLYHMRRFLDNSISNQLRFCSRCLSLHGCHFLYQQFLCLTCCPEHGTELIDFCPNCQTAKGFFQEPFSLVLCSKCGYDLRNSIPRLVSQAELEVAVKIVSELKLLLQPNFQYEPEEYIKHLGQTLADYRSYLRYSTDDMLEQLGVRYNIIQAIEYGELGRANVKFSHYQAYLAALGLSFHQIFVV